MILTEDRAASKPVCQGYVSLLSQSFEYPIYRVLAAAIRTARASQQIFGSLRSISPLLLEQGSGDQPILICILVRAWTLNFQNETCPTT